MAMPVVSFGLVIYRQYASNGLRVDMNLLLHEFRVVLAQALGRALSVEIEEQPAAAGALAAAAKQ